jgi:hypothetical protein
MKEYQSEDSKDSDLSQLETQKERLRNLNHKLLHGWKTQTLSLFKEIFGEDSEEYKSLNKYNFLSSYSNDLYDKQVKDGIPFVEPIMNAAIERLKNRQLSYTQPAYKQKQKRILFKQISSIETISFMFLVAGLIASAGYFFGELKGSVQNMQLKEDTTKLNNEISNLLDTIKLLRTPPLKESNNIPSGDTSSNKNK